MRERVLQHIAHIAHDKQPMQPNPKTRCGRGAKEAQREKREKKNSKTNVPKDLRFSMDINSDVPGFLVGKRKVEGGEVDEPAAAKGDGL